MPPLSLAEPTGRYLSFSEREEIALFKAQGQGVRSIARLLKRDPGTISRELRRNAATRAGKREYRAGVAQWKTQIAARRPKPVKLAVNPAAAGVRPGATEWAAAPCRRHRCRRPVDGLERAEQAAPRRSALGDGLESRADQPADDRRLPRR
jgi:hypothetical protein